MVTTALQQASKSRPGERARETSIPGHRVGMRLVSITSPFTPNNPICELRPPTLSNDSLAVCVRSVRHSRRLAPIVDRISLRTRHTFRAGSNQPQVRGEELLCSRCKSQAELSLTGQLRTVEFQGEQQTYVALFNVPTTRPRGSSRHRQRPTTNTTEAIHP